jgi:exopolysaccharide biosynthesis polyprenyl glycosylphosphotransferase
MTTLTEARKDLPLVATRSAREWRRQVFGGITRRSCQIADLVVLGTALFGILISPHVAGRSLTFLQFLQIHVTLQDVLAAVLCMAVWRSVLWSVGLYSAQSSPSVECYLLRLSVGLGMAGGLAYLVFYATADAGQAWPLTILFLGISVSGMALARLGLLFSWRHIRPHLRRSRNLIIVGSRQRALQAYQDLKTHETWNYKLLGYVDDVTSELAVPPEMILGSPHDIEQILMRSVVDEVVMTLPMKSQFEIIANTVASCQRLGVQCQYSTDQFGTEVTKRRTLAGEGSGRVVLQVVHNDHRIRVKRVFDVLGSGIGILLLSPVFLATILAVKLTSRGPIFFKQERFGLNKRTFGMLKFRSMVVDAEARQAALEHLNETSGPAFKIKNDPRITPIGRFIRKFSIDELPQLFNVLLGDMSLVGPRPLPLRDVGKFSEAWLMRRFSVRPGLTCLWQVSGRSNTDFDRWIELDLEYIDGWSLALDTKILFKTVPAVLKGRGAS